MDEFVKCLTCGKGLASKEKGQSNHCTECILDLKFQTNDISQMTINENLQKILDFFVSDVSSAFTKDPAARSLSRFSLAIRV